MNLYSSRRLFSIAITLLMMISLFSVCAMAEWENDPENELETVELEIPQPEPAFPTLWVRTVAPDGNAVGNLRLDLVLPSGEVAASVTTDENGLAAFDLADAEDDTYASIGRSEYDSSDYGPESSVNITIDCGSLVSVGGLTDSGFYAESPYVITVFPDIYNIFVDSGIANGTVIVSSSAASVHEIVTLTAAPFDGYILDSMQVKQGDMAVPLTVGGSSASFEMPSGDVTVFASFSEIPHPAFMTHSLVLSGELGLNFFMDLPVSDVVDYSGSYMLFAINGKTELDPYDPYDTDLGGNGYYGFTCSLNVLQLADPITAEFHYMENSVEKVISQQYTAEEYLLTLLNSDAVSDEVKTLARALTDYGYYSQTFLAGIENRTVNRDHVRLTTPFTDSYTPDQISDILNELAGQEFSRDRSRDIRSVTCSLYLDSTLSIYLYLDTSEEYHGEIRATLDSAPVVVESEADGRYRIVIPNLSADQLGDMHQVIIETSDSASMTVRISGLSYIKTCLANSASDRDMVNAMAALYSYYSAADALK